MRRRHERSIPQSARCPWRRVLQHGACTEPWLDVSGALRTFARHAVVSVALVLLSAASLGAQTLYVVDSAADGADADTADGLCDDGSGACTLRAALEQANASAGTDTIHFSLAGSGPHLIQPDTLPHITDPVVIDGYSQPGASPNTNGPDQGSNAVVLIVVDVRANSSLLNTRGPTIAAGGSTVRGLALHGGDLWSIRLVAGDGNVIEGNMLGDPNNGSSNAVVLVQSSDNTIGGVSPAARNVISGGGDGIRIETGSGNLVAGNLIGTDAAGTAVLGHNRAGVAVTMAAEGTTVGGDEPGARNVIGGGSDGVSVEGVGTTGTIIHGNYIGVDVTGSAGLGVGSNGIFLDQGSSLTTVGGSGPGQGNVIAAAGDPAIRIHSNDNTIQGNLIGLDATGTTAIPNDYEGIYLDQGASGNRIGGPASGEGNTVANSGTMGVSVVGDATANTISGNSIFDNPIGIDLGYDGVTDNDAGDSDSGPNDLLNFPDLSVAYTGSTVAAVEGSYNGLAGGMITLEFFASDLCNTLGYGEGERFVGSTTVTTDGGGQSTFSAPVDVLVSPGEAVTATATDADGNTSEFSNCVIGSGFTVTAAPETVVVSAGQTASFTVSVTADGPFFDQPVTLSCAGTLPAGSSCSFSPPEVTPGTGTATSTLSIAGSGALTSQPVGVSPWGVDGPPANPEPSTGLIGLGLAAGLIAMLLVGAGPRRRAAWATAAALGCAAVFVAGCSDGPIVPDDPVSSTFDIVGTSGPLQESVPVTVTVE